MGIHKGSPYSFGASDYGHPQGEPLLLIMGIHKGSPYSFGASDYGHPQGEPLQKKSP